MHHDPVRATYKGDGSAFHPGIPARDLYESEYQAMSADERALVRSSALYDTKTDKEVAGKPDAPAKAAAPQPETKE